MKTLRFLGIAFLFISLHACIVKSIQPFYTDKAVSFDPSLLGKFTDNKQGTWEVLSFQQAFEKDQPDAAKYSKDDKEALKKYGQAYVIKQIKKEKEALFLAVPFKVESELFLDFTPIMYDDSDANTLALQHLLKTHSVAKLNKLENEVLQLQWLDETPLSELLKTGQIKLKHEIVGIDDTLILTATSDELFKFLQKFEKSDIENKWKNAETYSLTRISQE